MSKYQEALKRLRTNEYLTSREQRKYYNLLQELVDKEKGRKPIYKNDGYGMRYYFCESCNERIPLLVNCIDQHKYPYCPYCGQKLDWGDGE